MGFLGYSEEFKKAAVQKVLLRGSQSVESICQELGISTPSLYEWKRQYAMIDGMKKSPRRPQDWSAIEKFQAVIKFDQLNEQERGEFLRREGLHTDHIETWKKQMQAGLDSGKNRSNQESKAEMSQLKAKNKQLEVELHRKDKALAETTALLVLKKKADLLWGNGEDE